MKMMTCEGEEFYTKPIANQNPELKVLKNLDGTNIIDFFLINEIVDIADYLDFLRELDNAQEGDLVKVHINCVGGVVDVALNIYDALINTAASVKIIMEGECASAASMILLAGDEWEVREHSYAMVHSWTGGDYGKWNEVQAQHDFTKRYHEKKFCELYKDFLTDDEIAKCLEGKDFWFDNKQVEERLQNYVKDKVARQKILEKITDKYNVLISKEVNKAFSTYEKSKEPKAEKTKR